MARVFKRGVLRDAAVIAALGTLLLAAWPFIAEAGSPLTPSPDIAADPDVLSLKNYLSEISGTSQSASPRQRVAAADDINRLQNYLAKVNGGKGRQNPVVAQGNKDDLLTPSSPAPAPSGSNKSSGDDLLTPSAPKGGNDLLTPAPAQGGNDLLTPGAKSPEDALKVAPAATKDSEAESGCGGEAEGGGRGAREAVPRDQVSVGDHMRRLPRQAIRGMVGFTARLRSVERRLQCDADQNQHQ
jgi:hypothetical protein